MREDRTGRRIRRESQLLDNFLRAEIKKRFKKYNVLHILCEEKGWTRSDYDRIMKWLNNYNRRVEIGLLLDALTELGEDWKEIFKSAIKERNMMLFLD